VAEQGFGLLNSLHISAIECFFREIRESQENAKKGGESTKDTNDSNYSDDQLLLAVLKYFEKGQSEGFYWPEFIRLILKSKRFSFHPMSDRLRTICDEKLANCEPETYSNVLNYDEKLELLENIVDGLHDLDDFKNFLNQRIEERS
jgi:hypothetical protein